MVIQISGWLGIILTLLGIITTLVTLFAFARASYAKADNERLMQSNKILSDRADVFDEEIKRVTQEKKDADADHANKLLELKLQLKVEADKVRVLQDLVTGKEELDTIKATLIAHDEKVQERHEVLIEHIDTFLNALTEKVVPE
jgi:hypothetical protein